ncbi:poly(A)-specific ribonuclease PNLDC1-like [Hydractinia symbiolongicarpus]|uniref:poly(A)-specific ribonuclease PNLDC1-like n=1 Tax=Hydractinia symbiolongicarpus TaxID=13093 RepID=UPI00255026E2|nr:poly(A)-specific ribonuclease PNLDC1-like [Hydractinia symbiolongicarpus]
MCDVTKQNFEQLFPAIKEAIQNASFVAIDSEFTGLSTSILYEPTLFDTAESRYEKLKKSLAQFTICQFGISAFVSDGTGKNRYSAHTYNFFICPQSFGPINPRFSCQASAIEFLTLHNFDFNKFMRDGISFINKDQEKSLRSYHQQNSIQQHISSIFVKQLDEAYITPAISKLDDFVKSGLKNDALELDFIPPGVAQYLFFKTVEKRFSNISCSLESNGVIVVKKVLNPDQKIDFSQEYEKIIMNIVGFSKVLQLLSQCKKPIIGHNMLSDLLLLYGKFFQNLPDSYNLFKKSINQILPCVYDTKHMAFVMRKDYKDVNFFEMTGLEELYKVFSSPAAMFYKLDTPVIVHADGCNKYDCKKCAHEAGYDAFLTGYVFIRLTHLMASKNVSSTDSRPFEFHEHLSAVKHFCNCVNIARAAVKYINLNGEDPPSTLPERFIVEVKDGRKLISAAQVAQDFLPFGSVDVKLLSQSQALVAVSNRRRARDVIKAFQRNRFYKVSKYKWWLHSNEMRSMMWYGGLATSGVLLCGLTIFILQRKSP